MIFSPQTAYAAEDSSRHETVKVGFFAMDGYHVMDEEGNRSGDGYDFLRLMARYWDVDYEYVGYDQSWDDMQQMLEDGEIDMVTSPRKTPEREEKFDFSRPIGTNHGILTVRSDNSTIVDGNYSTYNGMRVALLNGSSRDEELADFAGNSGTISVQSKKHEGTTFTVDIPLEITDKECNKSDTGFSEKVNLTGVNVLLAEDNELNAEVAAVQLEEFGMHVERAVDGKNAVDIFRNHPKGTFDVILMDVMMPEMNGYEATKAIRAMNDRPDGKTIPIIAMTASSFAEDIQASRDAGMNAHLSKPIVIDEVIKTILLETARQPNQSDAAALSNAILGAPSDR